MLADTNDIRPSDAALVDAFGGSLALEVARVKAAQYLSSGQAVPYEETIVLAGQGGKVSTVLSVSFRPSEDLLPRSDLRLVLERHTDHPDCQTVSASLMVRDAYQAHVLGVHNLCRPGTLQPSLEPVAGKIDPGDSTWETWKHEVEEERGVRPKFPFRSLRFMSHGLSAEKLPGALCTRNTAIEAVLEACGRSFDPASMQVNKPTPTEECVLRQWSVPAKDLPAYVAKMRSQGMHVDSNIGPFAVKLQQLERVLTAGPDEFPLSVVQALNVHSSQSAHLLPTAMDAQPDSLDGVTIERNEAQYCAADGTEIADVQMHYRHSNDEGTNKLYPISRRHKPQTVLIPIMRLGSAEQVMLVKQWQPGCGSGSQQSAWCLGIPRGDHKPQLGETDMCRIADNYSSLPGVPKAQILSRTGLMDADAGLCDAQHELVEGLFDIPDGASFGQSWDSQHPDCQKVLLPLNSFSDSLAEYTRDGVKVDFPVDAFATKLRQLSNAVKYDSSSLAKEKRHWSHALPDVLEDPKLQLTDEARRIQESFSSGINQHPKT